MSLPSSDSKVSISYKIGDALQLIELEDAHIDAVVSDPPFQIKTWSGQGIAAKREMYRNELTNIGSTPDFDIIKYADKLENICKPLVMIVFCAKGQIRELISWAEARYYVWDLLTWHKVNPIPFTGGHLLRDTEFILYIKEPGAYFPAGDGLDYKDFKTYHVADSPRQKAMHGGVKSKSIEHPCAKPINLMEKLVRIACPRGGTVLDPFAGSGTTLRAAALNGRSAIGYEINPQWEELLAAACTGRQTRLELNSREVIEDESYF